MKIHQLEEFPHINDIIDFNATINGENPLMYALAYNLENPEDLISKEEISYLIDNTDLKNSKFSHNNALFFTIKHFGKLQLSDDLFYKLVKDCNLKQTDRSGNNALMLALKKFKSMEYRKLEYLIKNSNLNCTNEDGETALSIMVKKETPNNLLEYALKNTDIKKLSKDFLLNLFKKDKDLFKCALHNTDLKMHSFDILVDIKEEDSYILKNIDLTITNKKEQNILMHALEKKDLKFTHDEIDFIIHNIDLKKVCVSGWNTLMYVFRYSNSANMKFSDEQMNYLIKNTDLSQKNLIDDGKDDPDGWDSLKFYKKNTNKKLSAENLQLLGANISIFSKFYHLILSLLAKSDKKIHDFKKNLKNEENVLNKKSIAEEIEKKLNKLSSLNLQNIQLQPVKTQLIQILNKCANSLNKIDEIDDILFIKEQILKRTTQTIFETFDLSDNHDCTQLIKELNESFNIIDKKLESFQVSDYNNLLEKCLINNKVLSHRL